MSFKSGCDISGEVVMTKIQWVQCLIQGCDGYGSPLGGRVPSLRTRSKERWQVLQMI